jgi:hypothetical protein
VSKIPFLTEIFRQIHFLTKYWKKYTSRKKKFFLPINHSWQTNNLTKIPILKKKKQTNKQTKTLLTIKKSKKDISQ